MSERLSAAEVVSELRDRSNSMRRYRSAGSELSSHLDEAADLVESHLVPQWQAEPTGDGWYWVRGIDVPCWVELTDDDNFADNGKWSFTGFGPDGDGHDYRPLNGREVCRISGPPSDEKGGA